MKFSNDIPFERQEIIRKQLREYERSFKDMTKKERHLLHMWVRHGNSPYENGDYVCDDNGQPMDFVNTLRFWEDMREYYDSLSEQERLRFRGDIEPEPIEIPKGEAWDGFPISDEIWQVVETEIFL